MRQIPDEWMKSDHKRRTWLDTVSRVMAGYSEQGDSGKHWEGRAKQEISRYLLNINLL